MTSCRLLESVFFVLTLIAVFGVLTLGLNFLVHVLVIFLVQAIVDISFVMKFLPVIALILVYIRDSLKVVSVLARARACVWACVRVCLPAWIVGRNNNIYNPRDHLLRVLNIETDDFIVLDALRLPRSVCRV